MSAIFRVELIVSLFSFLIFYTQSLAQTSLFKNVSVEVDSSSINNAGNSDVDVCVKLDEKSKYGFSIGVAQAADNGGVTGTFSAHVRNPIFGYGERLDVALTTDHNVTSPVLKTVSVKLNDLRPCVKSNSSFSVGVFADIIDKSDLSSFKARAEGATLGWTSGSRRHQVEYQAAFRQIAPISSSAAIVSEGLVPAFKSAVRYNYRLDQRLPSAIAPTSGYLLNARLETSGLGGDVAVARAEVLAQQHFAITPLISLGLTARAGVAQPWSNIVALARQKAQGVAPTGSFASVPVLDRFFQNTLFVRGVSPRDIGPKADKDVLGGDLYTAFTASLSTAIPRYEGVPIRPHVFANAGNLVSFTDYLNGPRESKCPLANSTVASAGFGVVLPTALGRIEFNMASPLNRDGSIGKLGFALGASMEW